MHFKKERMTQMVNIITKELRFDEELKKKIEFVCGFRNTTPTIIKKKYGRTERIRLFITFK